MITKPFACVLLGMAGFAASALAQAAPSSCVRLDGGWIRFPAMAHMAGGFGRIDNTCKTDVAVTAVRSPAFKDVSVHETTLVDGVSRMRAIERLPLAAGKGVELKPGGLHLMLMDGSGPLQEGQRVPVSLVLSDGTEVPGELVVRRP
ncbi:copper chaperone PCu(A)C [Stenotrophomonas acidaminiphila]|uniref:copper chaperone PCu(A)C n=1 Tax=Stenotrophomonas acidaminiphila TaxID=128780 RepID=UPI0028ABCFAC|nr:copper chaperone PCu(A)C [Stenotrophomonas acidaminiphila]